MFSDGSRRLSLVSATRAALPASPARSSTRTHPFHALTIGHDLRGFSAVRCGNNPHSPRVRPAALLDEEQHCRGSEDTF